MQQQYVLQCYEFGREYGSGVTTRPTGPAGDCTSANSALHWTNDVERYCWVDFQAILAAIPATAQVNAPDAVAAVWGMPPPPQ